MTKEQTPIEWLVEQICTEVEMYDDYGNVERIEFWNAFKSCTDLSKYINNAKEMEKERIQAKVLEALEKYDCEFCNSKVVANMYCCSNCSESGMIKNTTKQK